MGNIEENLLKALEDEKTRKEFAELKKEIEASIEASSVNSKKCKRN